MLDTPVFASAAVAAPHRLASEAGRAVLAEGGNAIEAMVAMAATLVLSRSFEPPAAEPGYGLGEPDGSEQQHPEQRPPEQRHPEQRR